MSKSGRKVWGPLGWNFIHIFTYACPDNAPPKLIKKYKKLIERFSDIIPCHICLTHCKLYLKSHPMKFSNKTQMIDYFIEFHNNVNRRLKKKKIYTRKESNSIYSTPNFGKLKQFINYWKKMAFNNDINILTYGRFLQYYIYLFPGGHKKKKLYILCNKFPMRKFFYFKVKRGWIIRWFQLTLDKI